MDKITEKIELIYAESKLLCDKITHPVNKQQKYKTLMKHLS